MAPYGQELAAQMPKMLAIAAVAVLAWDGDREVRMFVLGGLIGWLSQEERRGRDALPPRTYPTPPTPERHDPDFATPTRNRPAGPI